MQISQKGSIKEGECGGRETVYFRFRQQRDLSRPRCRPQGPNGMEVIMLPNSIATIGLMRTVSKSGDRSAQAISENVADPASVPPSIET